MKEYLKNLPKSDDNEDLQQLSLKALKSVLPIDKFLLRDERVDDKGVDGSLEVKHEQSFTNFRSQVQLKGTSLSKQNKDESVSYSVSTSNLNYLLNNPISLYLLYIEPRNEFRFVWAKDESKRLEEENPQWNEQESITLRFAQILDENTIEQIHEKIIREGGLFRKINESISANFEDKSKFEIDLTDLEVLDQNKVKKILDLYGLELLNSGYENFVLEKYDLLAYSEKKRTKFLLLKSRAEGMSGRYRAALDTLGIIDSVNSELSPVEKFHFESTENHINWQLGEIDTEQFLAKLQELSTNDLVKNSILDKFNFLHFSLMYGKRREFGSSELFEQIKELKNIGEEVLSDKNISQEIKVNVEFSILENELKWLILEQTSLNGESAIYDEASVYVPEHWDRKENFPNEIKKWVNKSNELLNKSQNVITRANISYLQISLWFHQNQSNQFWSANTGKEYIISKEISDFFIEKLHTIIKIYTDYQDTYSMIRAKMLMVEILSLTGKPEESENLRKQINKQANRMSYEALKNLTEFSIHKGLYEYSQDMKSNQDV